jgi:tRNA dimethylallyltransferase
MVQPPRLILAGPTASGKSNIAHSVARELGDVELLSCDSVAVYEGLEIGSAKPSPLEQSEVHYHGVSIRKPNEVFSAADFVSLFENAKQKAQTNHNRLWAVGGSAFYVRAAFLGMWDAPAASEPLRARLMAEPIEALYAKLLELDPESAKRVGTNDRYRLVRANEVMELTGKTPSELENERAVPQNVLLWTIDRDDSELSLRIRARTKAMLARGWIDEVKGLSTVYPPDQVRALRSVGYLEILRFLKGEQPPGRKKVNTLAELEDEIVLATHQLARTQRSFFRSLRDKRPEHARAWRLPDEQFELAQALRELP